MNRTIGILLALGLGIAAVHSAEQAKPSRDLDQLKAFYQQKCARCHGEDGAAHSPTGKKLRGLDFTDGNEMMELTDKGMAKTIRNGLWLGLRMPGFKSMLNDEEIALMINGVLRQAEKGKKIAPSTPPPPG
jgi:mono/diheme cytochrome c family protein